MKQHLKVWRLHPAGARIVPAEKTLNGTANEGGVKWCGPYSTANRLGWWLFPPVDFDVIWRGGREFEHALHTPYNDEESALVRSLVRAEDDVDPDRWCPVGSGRTKMTIGGVDDGVIQIWTGCIFQTPPGWCLHMRSPVNCAAQPYYVQEGILETDWMQYDIWVNLQFTQKDVIVQLRRNQWPPVAQLIPVRRESTSQWEFEEETVNRDTPEANRVFEYWIQYNKKKYEMGGKQYASSQDSSVMKDSTTFFKERMRCMNLMDEHLKNQARKLYCQAASPKTIKPFVRKKDNT